MKNTTTIKSILANASKAVLDLNRGASSAKPERAVRHGSVGQAARKKGNTGRRAIVITSRRVRPIDPDNCVGKYFIDSLRYAGILRGDAAKDIDYAIRQEKVDNRAEETTVIEISEL